MRTRANWPCLTTKAPCTLKTSHRTPHTAHRTLHAAHGTMCTPHCALHTVRAPRTAPLESLRPLLPNKAHLHVSAKRFALLARESASAHNRDLLSDLLVRDELGEHARLDTLRRSYILWRHERVKRVRHEQSCHAGRRTVSHTHTHTHTRWGADESTSDGWGGERTSCVQPVPHRVRTWLSGCAQPPSTVHTSTCSHLSSAPPACTMSASKRDSGVEPPNIALICQTMPEPITVTAAAASVRYTLVAPIVCLNGRAHRTFIQRCLQNVLCCRCRTQRASDGGGLALWCDGGDHWMGVARWLLYTAAVAAAAAAVVGGGGGGDGGGSGTHARAKNVMAAAGAAAAAAAHLPRAKALRARLKKIPSPPSWVSLT